jgi:5-methylcytosine-specific restriction endonuclease McrA
MRGGRYGGQPKRKDDPEVALQINRWRRKVLERDGCKCRKCGKRHPDGKGLRAHHVKPWTGAAHLRYRVSNGITYCEDCHGELHEGGG